MKRVPLPSNRTVDSDTLRQGAGHLYVSIANVRKLPTSVALAVIGGLLLPWIAVALYGEISLILIDRRIALFPETVEAELLTATVFLLPALIWGTFLSAIVPRSHSIRIAVLSGACAVVAWLAHVPSFGLPGTTVSSVSMLTGVFASALGVSMWRKGNA